MRLHRLFALAAVLAGLMSLARAAQQAGTVDYVVDGDTLIVSTDTHERITVRLANIDAPELGQAWGKKSKRALAKIASGQRVVLSTEGHDRYGRVIASVSTRDGTDLSTAQVKDGMAWAYRAYLTNTSFIELEATARARHLGLWASGRAVEPDIWRRRKGQSSAESAGEAAPIAFAKGDGHGPVLTGSRGGRYYLNKSGRRTYLRK